MPRPQTISVQAGNRETTLGGGGAKGGMARRNQAGRTGSKITMSPPTSKNFRFTEGCSGAMLLHS
jgi:hypothetical protein